MEFSQADLNDYRTSRGRQLNHIAQLLHLDLANIPDTRTRFCQHTRRHDSTPDQLDAHQLYNRYGLPSLTPKEVTLFRYELSSILNFSLFPRNKLIDNKRRMQTSRCTSIANPLPETGGHKDGNNHTRKSKLLSKSLNLSCLRLSGFHSRGVNLKVVNIANPNVFLTALSSHDDSLDINQDINFAFQEATTTLHMGVDSSPPELHLLKLRESRCLAQPNY